MSAVFPPSKSGSRGSRKPKANRRPAAIRNPNLKVPDIKAVRDAEAAAIPTVKVVLEPIAATMPAPMAGKALGGASDVSPLAALHQEEGVQTAAAPKAGVKDSKWAQDKPRATVANPSAAVKPSSELALIEEMNCNSTDCNTKLMDADKIFTLRCGHSFCEPCIKKERNDKVDKVTDNHGVPCPAEGCTLGFEIDKLKPDVRLKQLITTIRNGEFIRALNAEKSQLQKDLGRLLQDDREENNRKLSRESASCEVEVETNNSKLKEEMNREEREAERLKAELLRCENETRKLQEELATEEQAIEKLRNDADALKREALELEDAYNKRDQDTSLEKKKEEDDLRKQDEQLALELARLRQSLAKKGDKPMNNSGMEVEAPPITHAYQPKKKKRTKKKKPTAGENASHGSHTSSLTKQGK